jgi:hypothetical protein
LTSLLRSWMLESDAQQTYTGTDDIGRYFRVTSSDGRQAKLYMRDSPQQELPGHPVKM